MLGSNHTQLPVNGHQSQSWGLTIPNSLYMAYPILEGTYREAERAKASGEGTSRHDGNVDLFDIIPQIDVSHVVCFMYLLV